MNPKIERYDVYDKKNEWMGGYSTALNLPNQPNALEMARINMKHCLGRIVAVHEGGLEEEVASLVIKK